MSVLKRDVLFEKIKAIIGETATDETLVFLEDVSDTLNDLETRVNDKTDWKEKYEQNDIMWRKKYKDRFFNAQPEEKENEEADETAIEQTNLSYENLFKKE